MKSGVLTGILAVVVLAGGVVAGQSAEAGFTPLFDGKSLDGWVLVGKKEHGYIVRDGVIACPQGGGGNLLTDRDYSDFILRFEFRLEPGSNNGLGIRAPINGRDIAYDGIELQIIDDSAEKYKELQPWQRHGSLYHVFPAKTGFLKPVGEWNQQEVIADGSKIKVILNGNVILDVDTRSVTDPELLKKHPGLNRTTGRIGFLGHNDPVEFRNIRIKELNQ